MRYAILTMLFVSPLYAQDPIPGVTTRTVATPSEAKRNQTLFVNGGKLYTFGGTKSLDPRDFDPKNFADEGHVLDLATGEVKILKKPPIPMMRGNTVVRGNKGYAIGGQTHDGQKMVLTDTIYEYDFAHDEWTKLDAKLPSPRTLFGLAEHDGVIWVLGGWAADASRAKSPKGAGLKTIDEIVTIDLKPAKPTVTVLGEKLAKDRRSYPFATSGSKLWICGGLNDQFAYVPTAEVFDMKSQTWEKFPAPNQARAMAEMVELDGKLYLAGGFSEGPKTGKPNPFVEKKSLEVYDIKSQTWSDAIPTLPVTIGGSALNLFTHKGQVYVWSLDQTRPNLAHLTTIDPTKLGK
jgi:Kelch motif/Galactose oxidase, central domain